MKIKTYLFTLFCITLLSLGVFLTILFNFDPTSADFITKSAFFASIFILTTGLLTFSNFYIRIWATNKEVIFSHLPISIRHSVLISLVFVGLMILSSLKVLTWWDAGMFIVVIIMLELFFRTRPPLQV